MTCAWFSDAASMDSLGDRVLSSTLERSDIVQSDRSFQISYTFAQI